MSSTFFITGMLRSGTTLLDRMLCVHPQLSVLSQPFINLFIETKRIFCNKVNGQSVYHVLHHYFAEDNYSINDLSFFLSSFKIPKTLIENLVDEYWRLNPLDKLSDDSHCFSSIEPGTLDKVYSELVHALRHKNRVAMCGAKEVLCEEFLPFFISSGIKCIQIIRDPRDVIASLNYGNGQNYTGQPRPTLFNIRIWRKSAALIMELRGAKNYLALKYEDLVCQPAEEIEKITRFLGVKTLPGSFFDQEIRDQKGLVWQSNTSFQPDSFISSNSVGSFDTYLPAETLNYIEATCYPEMRALGYSTKNTGFPNFAIIEQYREPFPVERPEFSKDYSMSPENIRHEIERIKLLNEQKLSDNIIRKYFVFPSAHKQLIKFS